MSILPPLEEVLVHNSEKYMGAIPLDDTTFYLKYRRNIVAPESRHQCFSKFWILIRIPPAQTGKVLFRFADQYISVSPPIVFFIPAFTPVEWLYYPGVYEYEAYSSYTGMDDGLPKHPLCFPYERYTEIRGYNDIVDLLRQRDHLDLSLRRTRSYAAERAKGFLDRYFAEGLSFEEICNDIRLSHRTMGREFKNYYGLTPVAYRNVLRTFEAFRLLRNGESVTQAGLMAGFSGMTQYNDHFHRVFGVSPRHFVSKAVS